MCVDSPYSVQNQRLKDACLPSSLDGERQSLVSAEQLLLCKQPSVSGCIAAQPKLSVPGKMQQSSSRASASI